MVKVMNNGISFLKNDLTDFKSLEGKMLVASPHMSDPFFEKSLVYICAHDENGIIGLIINQQIGTVSIVDMLKNSGNNKKLKTLNKKYPVLFGGPVNSDLIVALSLTKTQEVSFNEHRRADMHADAGSFLQDVLRGKNKPSKLILAKGVSAWDADQLESEISDNAWFIIDPSLSLLFSQRIKRKWDSVIKELGVNNLNYLVHYSGNA